MLILVHPLSVKFWDWVCKHTKFILTTNASCPLRSSSLRSQHTVASVSASPENSWWMPLSECLWAPSSQPLELPRYSHVAVPLGFFQSWKQKKKSHGERSGEYGGCASTVTLSLVRNLETLFISDVHSSNSKIRHWQRTQGFPLRPAA
jgi:hypothetical protein